jgi:hypothetical protein
MWAPLISGGLNLAGSLFGAGQANKMAMAGLRSADRRADMMMQRGRETDTAQLGSKMADHLANLQMGERGLALQKDAALFQQDEIAPRKARNDVDAFNRMVGAESGESATKLRQRKNREGLASKMLATNAAMSGMFGPTAQDQMYKSHLGMFG